MPMGDVKWCCESFEMAYARGGQRGQAVLYAWRWGEMRFYLQSRAMDRGSEVPLDVSTPVATVAESPLSFCPWCGARLSGYYTSQRARMPILVEALPLLGSESDDVGERPVYRWRRRVVALLLGVLVLTLGVCGVLAPVGGMVVWKALRTSAAEADPSECKRNLRAWFMAERTYFAQHEAYRVSPAEVGFAPAPGNRYAYFAGPGPGEGIGVDPARPSTEAVTFSQLPRSLALQVGLLGQCPECALTLVCAGRVGPEGRLDIWSLSTEDRRRLDGTPVLAGEPSHEP